VIPEVAGFDVDARDGHIGKVDEQAFHADSTCLVVDTGFWLFGTKRMVTASVIERVDEAERRVFLSVPKQVVQMAPEYDEERHQADIDAYHAEHEMYYDQYGNAFPALPPVSEHPSNPA
jgi:hypothetical protein